MGKLLYIKFLIKNKKKKKKLKSGDPIATGLNNILEFSLKRREIRKYFIWHFEYIYYIALKFYDCQPNGWKLIKLC